MVDGDVVGEDDVGEEVGFSVGLDELGATVGESEIGRFVGF